MRQITQEQPLMEIHDAIKNEFEWYVNNRDKVSMAFGIDINFDDKILKLILENNGCSFGDNARYHSYTFETITGYNILFIYNAKANEANDFFDYIEYYNNKYLIIFMDYFLDLFTPRKVFEDDESPEARLERIMGKSVYFDALRKIVNVFIASTTSAAELNNGELAATSASAMYRFAGALIAAHILNLYLEDGLTENDVSGVDYNAIYEMIDNISIEALLLGIRHVE